MFIAVMAIILLNSYVYQSLFDIPGVAFTSYKFDYCVNDVTESGQVHIDLVEPRFGIAVGGNGNAAKSSDEIGKIAARWVFLQRSGFAFHDQSLNVHC